MTRSSGIIMPIFSLPSKYGIGTMGKEAYEFANFLSKSKQKYWQMLPLGPTGYGDSPYQPFSSFAGNPYFIDFEMLIEEGILKNEDLDGFDFGDNENKVDYEKIYNTKFNVLEKAYDRDFINNISNISTFVNENSYWINDYALFMSLKEYFNGMPWTKWPEDIKTRKENALNEYRNKLANRISFYIYIQYLYFKQWNKLKEYINSKGIKIIGDIPIYVSSDSSDIWSSPKYFELDENLNSTNIAGVPPDYFSKTGQRWGNPLYNWTYLKEHNYDWWMKRIEAQSKLFDVIRIDHFRGIASYWSIPSTEETAINGKWEIGPRMDFIDAIKNNFPNLELIAEDLGILSDDVVELLENSKLPGMKVLEFAFDSDEPSEYLPHKYNENCICYIGTHDNDTVLGWLNSLNENILDKVKTYAGLNKEEGYVYGMIRLGMSSKAKLFITQFQDYLELDSSARINTPGKEQGNWTWRMNKTSLSDSLANKISKLVNVFER